MKLNLPLKPYYLKLIESSESVRRLAVRAYVRGGSAETVRSYIDGVIMLCKFLGMEPDEALKAKLDWEGVLNEFIAWLLYDRGVARTTALNYFKGVKKWLQVNLPKDEWNSIDWRNIEKPRTWRVERERIPEKETLKLIMQVANPRDRAVIALAVSSGLRQSTILNLKLKNIKVYENGKITSLLQFLRENMEPSSGAVGVVVVEPEIAKERPEKYMTFCTHEALKYILTYLKMRLKSGENLTESSYLIVDRSKRKMKAHALKCQWIRLLERAGKNFKHRKWHLFRFHTLRKYFSTWTKLSGVDPWVVEAWMGHKAGIHQVYFLSGIEDLENPVLIERLVEEYRKAIPALTIFTEEEKIRELEQRLEQEIKEQNEKLKKIEEKYKREIMELQLMVKQLIKKIEEMEKHAKPINYSW